MLAIEKIIEEEIQWIQKSEQNHPILPALIDLDLEEKKEPAKEPENQPSYLE